MRVQSITELIMANTAEVFKFPDKPRENNSKSNNVARLDNGYTRLANEILEAAIGHDLSKRQYKILLAVIRKTYGFQKASDRISGSQLSELTNLPRARCSEVLNELIDMSVIIRTGGTQGQIEINKVISEWKSLQKSKPATTKRNQNSTTKKPKQNTTETVTLSSTETVTLPSTETVHTKEISKNNSKDNELAKANSCSEQCSEPAIAWIPTNKRDEVFNVTQSMIDEWTETFPGVDVMQQLRTMYSWSKANPTKRKTLRGMPRFIVNWLSREQDKPKPHVTTHAKPSNHVGDQLAQLQAAVSHLPEVADNEVL